MNDMTEEDFEKMMTPPTRQVGMAVAAGLAVLICLVLSMFAGLAGGWWLLGLIPTALLGIPSAYGIWESLQNVPRDSKGNPL